MLILCWEKGQSIPTLEYVIGKKLSLRTLFASSTDRKSYRTRLCCSVLFLITVVTKKNTFLFLYCVCANYVQHMEPFSSTEYRPRKNGHHHHSLHWRSPTGWHGISTHLIQGKNQLSISFYIFVFRQIGLMRSGHLLAEESPQNLLINHGLRTLEEVFLKLSRTERAKKHGALTASGRAVRPSDPSQQEDRGHDNPAFICTADNPDATSTGTSNNRTNISPVSN